MYLIDVYENEKRMNYSYIYKYSCYFIILILSVLLWSVVIYVVI